MKSYSLPAVFLIFLVVAFIAVAPSCKKEHVPSCNCGKHDIPPARKVRYELFTTENFSGNLKNIIFTVHMKGGKVDFDSSLATMKVKDIPDFDHRIIVEKWVPGNDTATLSVGFLYQIVDVGMSWYLEPFAGKDTLKVLTYSFK